MGYSEVMEMTAESLRIWLEARRGAEERERDESRRERRTPAEAFEQALQLIAFTSRIHGWPIPDDPLSLEQDRIGYERWESLRKAWRLHDGKAK